MRYIGLLLRVWVVTAIDRTAYPRFKRVLPARELAEAFTPTVAEVAWAREKTQSDQHLLALVVWLKSYQRLGHFPKLDEVPAAVVEHVRGLLDLSGEVTAEHDADRTAKWHRGLVRSFMGVKYDSGKARAIAEEAIRRAVTTKDNPADLINVALKELVRARRELPGFSTLDRMVAAIRTETNTALYAMVAARIDLAAKARLTRLLWLDPTSGRSEFDRLKTPAKAATLGKFKLRLAHLQALDELGATEQWLDGIPATKIAHFAGEARVTDVGDMRDNGDAKRLTLLASLIHECRTSARDEVATMFCKRMAVIHKKGKERLQELHEQHRAESERLLDVFGDVLAGARKPPHRPKMTRSRRSPRPRLLSGPGGCCSRRWPTRVGWSSCRRRMRWCRRTTATTTCRCWRSSTRATARRCSPCLTPWSWSRPARITACWTRWSSCARSGAAPASTSRRR
jgi:hypothetical protein